MKVMAIAGDLKPFGAFASLHRSKHHTFKPAAASSSDKHLWLGGSFGNGSSDLKITTRWPHMNSPGHDTGHKDYHCFAITEDKLSTPINQDAEGFLLNAINMSFFDRLSLAWRILFPTPTARRNSNAKIAKQRLKMILFSDRCAISDEAKQKIVTNIVKSLSDFVEIDSEDKVQLNVSTDTDLGTVYSVTVPVRRVKPEYQDSEEDYKGKITGIEYRDTGEKSGAVDVTFDFYVPNGN